MEFPIYTKHPKGLWYSKLVSKYESITIQLRALGSEETANILCRNYSSITSTEYDFYSMGKDIECTREEFMEMYDKAIERIKSKL